MSYYNSDANIVEDSMESITSGLIKRTSAS